MSAADGRTIPSRGASEAVFDGDVGMASEGVARSYRAPRVRKMYPSGCWSPDLDLHIHDVGVSLHHAVSDMEGGLKPHLRLLH